MGEVDDDGVCNIGRKFVVRQQVPRQEEKKKVR